MKKRKQEAEALQENKRKGGRRRRKMAEKKGYDGKISNAGAQHVAALHPKKGGTDKTKVVTGKDLRGQAGGK